MSDPFKVGDIVGRNDGLLFWAKYLHGRVTKIRNVLSTSLDTHVEVLTGGLYSCYYRPDQLRLCAIDMLARLGETE